MDSWSPEKDKQTCSMTFYNLSVLSRLITSELICHATMKQIMTTKVTSNRQKQNCIVLARPFLSCHNDTIQNSNFWNKDSPNKHFEKQLTYVCWYRGKSATTRDSYSLNMMQSLRSDYSNYKSREILLLNSFRKYCMKVGFVFRITIVSWIIKENESWSRYHFIVIDC